MIIHSSPTYLPETVTMKDFIKVTCPGGLGSGTSGDESSTSVLCVLLRLTPVLRQSREQQPACVSSEPA
jgi:hypothetical protein